MAPSRSNRTDQPSGADDAAAGAGIRVIVAVPGSHFDGMTGTAGHRYRLGGDPGDDIIAVDLDGFRIVPFRLGELRGTVK